MNAPQQLRRRACSTRFTCLPFLFIPVSRVRARFLSLSTHSCPCPHMQSKACLSDLANSNPPEPAHLVRRLPPTRTRSTREFVRAFLLCPSVRPSLRVLLLSSSLLRTNVRPSVNRVRVHVGTEERQSYIPMSVVVEVEVKVAHLSASSHRHVLASLSGTHALTALHTASHRKDRQPYPTHATDSLVSRVSKT